MRLRPTIATLATLSVFGAAFVVGPAFMAAPAFAADQVPMAAHRALYRLNLESTHGGDVTGATGTMAYEVTDACEGWATRQRLAMKITNRDGQDIELISDYATWESKDGLSMRFRMRQTTDTAVTEQVEGTAKLDKTGGPGAVHYTVPEEKEVPLPDGTLFPMVHTEAIIHAAEAGKRFLNLPIFDGTGDRGAQDSFIVVSNWGASENPPYPALANLPSGRVHVSFFDRNPKPSQDKVAGSPDYEVGMRYFGNGVADDLHMDFADFMMRGKLAEFAETPPHC